MPRIFSVFIGGKATTKAIRSKKIVKKMFSILVAISISIVFAVAGMAQTPTPTPGAKTPGIKQRQTAP